MSPAANRQGILAMLLAMSAYIGSDTLLKIVTAALPPGEIMAVRGLFATLMTFGVVAALGEIRRVRGVLSPVVLARAALEGIVAFLFITALARMPLADLTAIIQATPLILTLLCVLLGLERVGLRRWGAIAVGFAGVLLIVRPSASGLDAHAGLALLCALLVAGRDLAVRFVPAAVPSVVVALSSAAAAGISGAVIGFGELWRLPSAGETGLLLAAAACVAIGNLAIIRSFRVGDASVVSPFRYSIVLMSIALGALVFGEWPDRLSVLGIALICSSGLYTLHRGAAGRAGTGAAARPRFAAE